MRVALEDHRRPVRRRDHARARRAVDPHRRLVHRRGAGVLAASPRACSPASSTRKCRAWACIRSRSRSRCGFDVGLINERVLGFVETNARKLNDAIDARAHAALRILRPAHAVRPLPAQAPDARASVIETPQQFWMRIACALSDERARGASSCIGCISSLDYIPSSPTLFNSGTRHEQLSSCFLLDSPQDSLESHLRALQRRRACCRSSPAASAWPSTACAREGSLIRATNGLSNGIVPWLKTLDSSVAAVNQGGKRKGAACVYLEPWHADIEEFLELRDNTGDEARRTHNLNLANWIPRPVHAARGGRRRRGRCSIRRTCRSCRTCAARRSKRAYVQAEAQGLARKQCRRATCTRA